MRNNSTGALQCTLSISCRGLFRYAILSTLEKFSLCRWWWRFNECTCSALSVSSNTNGCLSEDCCTEEFFVEKTIFDIEQKQNEIKLMEGNAKEKFNANEDRFSNKGCNIGSSGKERDEKKNRNCPICYFRNFCSFYID